MYHVADTEYFLIPTAEVTLTNYHGGEILSERNYLNTTLHSLHVSVLKQVLQGRDTRGLIRQHQFNKS